MPTPLTEDELVDFVLGECAAEARVRIAVEVRRDPQLAAHVRALEEAYLNVGALSAPGGSLERLERALAGGARFSHLVDTLSSMFDLSSEAVHQLLNRIDDDSAWEPGFAPGMRLMPIAAGPACALDFTVMLSLEPGATYPHHEHIGDERVLVLEGGYVDLVSGAECWRGDIDVHAKGTGHSFRALSTLRCICAARMRASES
jgi:hypothetical protein